MNNQDIFKFYLEGNSLTKTCEKFKISKHYLKNILNENDIHIRSRREQCILENKKRGYSINHNYFSNIDSNKKAY